MITIYTRTRNILSIEFWKYLIKKICGLKRGPHAVIDSLTRGLCELKKDYELNPIITKEGCTYHALSSISSLKHGINLKKRGKIKRLIAGPNISVLPTDNESIIFNSEIDIILQPSLWTKNLYEKHSQDPNNSSRIMIWPAGVKDPYVYKDMPIKNDFFIVFQKNSNKEMFEFIINALESKKINYKIIEYGKFKQIDYLHLLEQSKAMIYLSKSESQGIALQEAWVRNTPTFVWDRGFWEYNGIKFEHEKISCPYLTEESGMTFRGVGDFTQKLDEFLEKIETFSARNYCIKNLTDKITAQIYIDIINSNEKFD